MCEAGRRTSLTRPGINSGEASVRRHLGHCGRLGGVLTRLASL